MDATRPGTLKVSEMLQIQGCWEALDIDDVERLAQDSD